MGLIWPELAEPPTQDSWNFSEARRERSPGWRWGREFLAGRAGVSCPEAPSSCGLCVCLGLAPGSRCGPSTAHTQGQVALLVGAQPCRWSHPASLLLGRTRRGLICCLVICEIKSSHCGWHAGPTLWSGYISCCPQLSTSLCSSGHCPWHSLQTRCSGHIGALADAAPFPDILAYPHSPAPLLPYVSSQDLHLHEIVLLGHLHVVFLEGKGCTMT